MRFQEISNGPRGLPLGRRVEAHALNAGIYTSRAGWHFAVALDKSAFTREHERGYAPRVYVSDSGHMPGRGDALWSGSAWWLRAYRSVAVFMALAMKVLVLFNCSRRDGMRACEATRDAGGRGDRFCIGRRLPDKIVLTRHTALHCSGVPSRSSQDVRRHQSDES
ncbi:hypothetical protein A1F94_012444 [Pyrenophora tritici-repentis]|nr:hypothetical protein A1F94_012444 [Pyrenophora tritici-repentis]